MKQLASLFLFFILFNSVRAETPEFLSPSAKVEKAYFTKKNNRTLGMDYCKRNYNVLKYNLFMDWTNPLRATAVSGSSRYFPGVNEITLIFDSLDASSVQLNAIGLQIDSIFVNSLNFNITPFRTDTTLDLSFGSRFKKGDTAVVKIYYQYRTDTNQATTDGIVIYDKPITIERIMFTMSEPENARLWMPCNDNPNDKAIATIAVKTPKDFVCVSNGLCADTIASDSNLTWVWKQNEPLATYLMMATVSKYYTYQDYYKRITNPNDSIPVLYAYWAQDSVRTINDTVPRYAKNALSVTPGLMSLFSEYYGEFPFVKYGMVVVYPFSYGGMEHQTMTSIARNWLYGFDEDGIAHELAHQWLGDYITCSSWNDLWINEGGATTSEVLWAEKKYGDYYGLQYKLYLKDNYINSKNNGAIRGDLFSYELTYCKAGWFYLMLRYMSGDDNYFAGLKNIFAKYKYGSLSMEEFKQAYAEVNPNPPVDYDTFFAQWLDSSLHPVYKFTPIAVVSNGINYSASFKLTQRQTGENVPNVFVMPVKIKFISKTLNRDTTITFLNNTRTATYSAAIDFPADSMAFDPNYEILCESISGTLTSVENKSVLYDAYLYPTPSISGEPAKLYINTENGAYLTEISLYNYLGERLQSIYNGVIGSDNMILPVNTQNLPSGAYFIQIKNAEKIETVKLNVIK